MQNELRFEARDLKPFAEPVEPSTLREGEVYFSLNFVDDDMFIPTLEPFVFVGRNLEPGEGRRMYFQDVESYRRGVRFETVSNERPAVFQTGDENSVNHIFEYERALDVFAQAQAKRRCGRVVGSRSCTKGRR
jgi:hypothetical protein